jgi:hypothetical protein
MLAQPYREAELNNRIQSMTNRLFTLTAGNFIYSNGKYI